MECFPVDVNTTDKEVKDVLVIQSVKKRGNKNKPYDGTVEVKVKNPQRKYHKTIERPKKANTDTTESTYHNGITEIPISKSENAKPKGKEIKVE